MPNLGGAATAFLLEGDGRRTFTARQPFAALQDQRRYRSEVTRHVEEIADERSKLNTDQPGMTGANDEQIRSAPDGEHAAKIEKEKQGDKQPNV